MTWKAPVRRHSQPPSRFYRSGALTEEQSLGPHAPGHLTRCSVLSSASPGNTADSRHSEPVNLCQASALTVNTTPPGSVVSRSMMTSADATFYAVSVVGV